ncbi:MAG: amidase family protein, partial [Ilumatobacteraceae bacterium]
MTATEDLERTLERIARHDGELGAFVDVLDQRARREAAEADAETAAGAAGGPLHGMPVGIKEIVDVAGADNSYGSDVRAGIVAERDALIVQR